MSNIDSKNAMLQASQSGKRRLPDHCPNERVIGRPSWPPEEQAFESSHMIFKVWTKDIACKRAWFRGPAVVAIHATEEGFVPDVPAVEKARLTWRIKTGV
jgi:hypothetical protein